MRSSQTQRRKLLNRPDLQNPSPRAPLHWRASIGAAGGLGIAVKVEDGNKTALYAVVADLLTQLEIGTAAQRAQFESFRAPPMRNTMGVEIGRMMLSVGLEAVGKAA
jgi:hypothetical protein